MADGQVDITDEQKDKRLADGMRDLLIKRLESGLLNASEMKIALELLEKRGYKYLAPGGIKSGALQRALPKFDEENRILKLG